MGNPNTWKDGSSTWEAFKDIKEYYPVQLCEYALESRLSDEPVFAWWLPHVIKKREHIISKRKSNIGLVLINLVSEVTKSISEAI